MPQLQFNIDWPSLVATNVGRLCDNLAAEDVDAAVATGFALAGIYPVGMKLVVSWTPQHTGHALGWLVGPPRTGNMLLVVERWA